MSFENTYTLYREKRKTVSIKVDINGDVIVKAPLYESVSSINDFIFKKHVWVCKQIEKAKEQCSNRYMFENMQKIMLFGNSYKIAIDSRYPYPKFFRNVFTIPHYSVDYIKDFIRQNTMQYISERLPYYSKLLCVTYNNMSLTNAKSRWGSCSSQKHLCFNYKLSMLEPSMIDYIIIHELCHLKHLNHSQDFWNEVSKYYPQYQSVKSRMSSFAFITHLYP